jgi:hypothetical protein
MQGFCLFFRTDAVEGLAVAGLNLIVACALVILSLTLCIAVFLLAGLPAPVRPDRATNAVRRRR